MTTHEVVTAGGIGIQRVERSLEGESREELQKIVSALDSHRGVVLSSTYEVPGRYTRWDIGFVNPCLEVSGRGKHFRVIALNARGQVLLPACLKALQQDAAVAQDKLVLGEVSLGGGAGATSTVTTTTHAAVVGEVRDSQGEHFAEEDRSRLPSLFSVVRCLRGLFSTPNESHLGLYGAFGYDLTFQFEPVQLHLPRPKDQRDMVLFLPDDMVVVDHYTCKALHLSYEFTYEGKSTAGIPRTGTEDMFVPASSVERECDHAAGEYADVVRKARDAFKRGDLFEAVASQTFFQASPPEPSELFRRLQIRNPAPFGFLINLGNREYLVGASPEMFVRVKGDRVETCPISGTIRRGEDAIRDAERIRELLNSTKEESELTMCTDVDRNDKSRICVPGSVRVIGRRQIEMYSRLIHTVDHVEGQLREGFDALDAFLCHTWAVTVTGAPKVWAMQFLEKHEHTCRAWYGGAVGGVMFDGSLNTGLTLRTVRYKDGVGEVRVGATLLYDSDPDAEEEETRLKASALLDALRRGRVPSLVTPPSHQIGRGHRVLLVDHQDSFVHTLANYLRQCGGVVVTLRSGFPHSRFDEIKPHLVVLSPGPGSPKDFDVGGTVQACVDRRIPIFGVCLGLQGIVEHFGGTLGVLDYPMHGKPSTVTVTEPSTSLFKDMPAEFTVGRYHSLYALTDKLPAELQATSVTADGVIMSVAHRTLPIAAVQFHPESIMTQAKDGLRLIANALQLSY